MTKTEAIARFLGWSDYRAVKQGWHFDGHTRADNQSTLTPYGEKALRDKLLEDEKTIILHPDGTVALLWDGGDIDSPDFPTAFCKAYKLQFEEVEE